MISMKVSIVHLCFMAVAVFAGPTSNKRSSLTPIEWLLNSHLEEMPSLDDISLESLEVMSLEDGAKLMHNLYHASQINHNLQPSFLPSPNSIPVHIIKPSGAKETCTLGTFVSVAKEQEHFGEDEVTIFITGLPSNLQTVDATNRKLINSYLQRYNQHKSSGDLELGEKREWKKEKWTTGNLVIIDLGATLTNFKRLTMLDVIRTGTLIGKTLVDLTNNCDVPVEILHIVAQGISCHVAGVAGNEYTRLTGKSLRRITALDPSKLYATLPNNLLGLSRSDAEFVDAIHTSAYGMGTLNRVGDLDFFPNGLSDGVPGADNVIEASMRATDYFAESLLPGNEHNFPAVKVHSLEDYKNNDGFGKRAYMGIDAAFDLKGDYMLEVNALSPFGKKSAAHKQKFYHANNKVW